MALHLFGKLSGADSFPKKILPMKHPPLSGTIAHAAQNALLAPAILTSLATSSLSARS